MKFTENSLSETLSHLRLLTQGGYVRNIEGEC